MFYLSTSPWPPFPFISQWFTSFILFIYPLLTLSILVNLIIGLLSSSTRLIGLRWFIYVREGGRLIAGTVGLGNKSSWDWGCISINILTLAYPIFCFLMSIILTFYSKSLNTWLMMYRWGFKNIHPICLYYVGSFFYKEPDRYLRRGCMT